jgi:hypothetical protein
MSKDTKPAPSEPKKAEERQDFGLSRKPDETTDAPVAVPSAKSAAKPAGDLRLPEAWATETGRTRKPRVAAFVNGTPQRDRTLRGDHTAAAVLHRWRRDDAIPRPITRASYEAAIRAAKRAPEGQREPQPHPEALWALVNGE